jgi:hypothetical protein
MQRSWIKSRPIFIITVIAVALSSTNQAYAKVRAVIGSNGFIAASADGHF